MCAAGGTIIVIHHSIRSDGKSYANSHQIGANVARAYNIVSEDRPSLHRISMNATLCRGAEPISEKLIGFPAIVERSAIIIAPSTTPSSKHSQIDRVVEFVKAQPGGTCNRGAVKVELQSQRRVELINTAITTGRLIERIVGTAKILSVPEGSFPCEEKNKASDGTDGNKPSK